MNHRGSELQVECGDTLCFSNHVDLDNPAVLENEVDDHARLTSWREHEAGVAVHQSKLRCSPAPSIGCVPPRRHRRQATSRPINPRVRWLKIKNRDYSQAEGRADLFNRPQRSAR